MDAMAQKLFRMLDSPEGERANALEMLHAQGNGSWAGDFLATYDQLEKANAKAQRAFAMLKGEIALLRGAISLRSWFGYNRQRLLTGGAVLACAAVGFNFFGPQTWPVAAAEREAVDKDLGRFGTEAWAEGESEPRIYRVGGKPYWVILRGDSETETHANDKGQPVVLQCVHIYAKPAEADYGVYFKPVSRSGFGWFTWPERVKLCKAK
jgi:hypothetical protein